MSVLHAKPLRRPNTWSIEVVPLVLFALLMGVLWIAGGASRADAMGQTIVRGTAWLILIVAALISPRPRAGPARVVAMLLAAAVLLGALQLMPLPPTWWHAMPGRAFAVDAATLAGTPNGWRPWSLTPSATANAVSSLVVPGAVFLCLIAMPIGHARRQLDILFLVIVLSMLVGLAQLSGIAGDNPLINDSAGYVSGTFANRNHFALFLAIGLAVAPVWAFWSGDPDRRVTRRGPDDRKPPNWRLAVVAALALPFAIAILTTGSRAGLILAVLGLAGGLMIVRQDVRGLLKRDVRRLPPLALALALVLVVACLIAVSVYTGRAVSLDRAMAFDVSGDMRGRTLPVLQEMIRTYLPWGTGLGGFDPMFRMHEPFALLKLTYFNHAHNDYLELALQAGLPGLILLVAALGWWLFGGVRIWRTDARRNGRLAPLGWIVLLLIFIASVIDYPARTPMIMAVVVLASVWLSGRADGTRDAQSGVSTLRY